MTAPYEIRLIGDPCCARGPPRSPTSTASWRSSPRTCSPRCTRPPASAWPPRRWACRSASSSTTSAKARRRSSTRRSSRADGEWAYDEGCLSIPGLAFELVRPKEVHLAGYDLDGNELSIEADELLGPRFQHELDHLDGVLFIERLDDDARKAAMKIIREQRLTAADLADAELAAPASRGRLQPSLSCASASLARDARVPPRRRRRRRSARLAVPRARRELAVPPLRALVEAGVDVALVVSQPDRRRGRGSDLVPSPVKAAALELGLPVTDRVDDVLDADVPTSAWWWPSGGSSSRTSSRRCRWSTCTSRSCPGGAARRRWSGRSSPATSAPGVDLMAVEEGLDTGGIYRRAEVPIGPDDTLEELRGRLVAEGTGLLVVGAAERARRADAAGRRADLRRQAHRRRSPLDWTRSGRRRPPPGAPRRRLDHPRGQAAQGLADARASRRGRPARARPPTARWSSSRCSPRARAAWMPAAWANGARWQPGDPLGT